MSERYRRRLQGVIDQELPVEEMEALYGWSSNGNLVTGTAIANGGNPLLYARNGNKINCQAKFSEPGYYTVQFETIPPQNTAAGNIVKSLAEVIWSVRGNNIRRLISVFTGSVISGSGEAVNVNMFDDSETILGQAPFPYAVSIGVTRGTRAATPQPPVLVTRDILTTNLGGVFRPPYLLNPTDFVNIPIPVDAGVNQLLMQAVVPVGAPADSPLNLKAFFFQAATSAIDLGAFNYDFFDNWMPVPPGARVVKVVNDSTNDSWAVTPIWGIEG